MPDLMIRALRPTDALLYVKFCHEHSLKAEHRAPVWPGAMAAVGAFFGRSLSLEPGRESWVQLEHGRITGLVTAKRRQGADVWDVDQLVYLPATDAPRTCARLLSQLLSAASDEGVLKVFLRLESSSPALDWARQVGFVQYSVETVYLMPEVPSPAHPPRLDRMRPRRPSDHQALFQLYCGAVPVRVRQAEGMTLQEWRWIDGWYPDPMGLPPELAILGRGGRQDFVVEDLPRLTAWLQVDRRQRRMCVLAESPDRVDVDALIRYGLKTLGTGRRAYCAIRDYQSSLAGPLEEIGFAAIGTDSLLTRALATRIPELKLVPVRAS
ncbi:MAG: hypothetical protein ACRDIY_23930 [Chloroflexota bacterium]